MMFKNTMLALVLAAMAALPARAQLTGCQYTSGPLQLQKVRSTAVGSQIIGCINASLDVLTSSAVVAGSTSAYSTLGWIGVNRISGLSSGAAGIWISSATTFTSSVTVNDVVNGLLVKSSVTGSGFFGNGSALTSLTGANVTGAVPLATTVTTNANLTGPVTSVGNATTITAGAVDTAKLAADSVTGVKILNGTIDTAKMNATIQTQLGASAVETSRALAAEALLQPLDADLTDLADGSLTGSKVGSGVPAANIADGTMGTVNTGGNAATATALAADPADAGAGYLARGVKASGVVELAWVETAATSGSTNPVTSGAMFTALAGKIPTGGLAGTATALAANGANCAAGSAPLGVDASGAVEGCYATATDISGKQDLDADLTDLADGSLTASKVGTGYLAASIGGGILPATVNVLPASVDYSTITAAVATKQNTLTAGSVTNSLLANAAVANLSGTNTGDQTTVSGNAGTATALAANPADCAVNQFATTIAASGALTCAALADADVPDGITVTLAATATALAANPAACAANQFGNDTTAAGALVCAALVDADIPNTITVDNATTAGTTTGNAGTATALSADPANAPSGFLAAGIAANGAAQNAWVETAATSGSTNPITSGAVYTGLAGKQAAGSYQASDADLDDLADGSLSGSKVGSGVLPANLAAGFFPENVTISTANVSPGFNGAGQIVKLDALSKLPAVDGSALTNLPSTSGGAVLAATQTFSGGNTFTNPLLALGGATPNSTTATGLASTFQGAIYATSADGATQSSGCVVTITYGTDQSASALPVFTSTTSSSIEMRNRLSGVLLETCVPGTACRVGIAGIYRVQLDASALGVSLMVETSATRCRVLALGGAADNRVVGRSLHTGGAAGNSFIWMQLIGAR